MPVVVYRFFSIDEILIHSVVVGILTHLSSKRIFYPIQLHNGVPNLIDVVFEFGKIVTRGHDDTGSILSVQLTF